MKDTHSRRYHCYTLEGFNRLSQYNPNRFAYFITDTLVPGVLPNGTSGANHHAQNRTDIHRRAQRTKSIPDKNCRQAEKKTQNTTKWEKAEETANTPEGFPPEYALIPSIVEPTNMLGKSMLSGVKDFSKYDKP